LSETAARFVYDVQDITKTAYQTRNLLRFVNNIRQLSNDINDLMKSPTIDKYFWTAVQLMRTITSLRRLLRLLRAASSTGAVLGGIAEVVGGDMGVGMGPTLPPPFMGFAPMSVAITANRNSTPIGIDYLDISMIPEESREAVQGVLERDAPNTVEDAYRSLQSQVKVWTGRLGGSIRWFPEPMGVSIQAGEYYADWVEEGHQSFTGYHYLQYAADMARMRLPGKIREELNKVINKEA